MSENLGFNQRLDLTNEITDRAIALLDLQEPLERALDDAYKAAINHADALRRDGQADPRKLLIAYGGLRAVVTQLNQQADRLGRLLDGAQPARAAK